MINSLPRHEVTNNELLDLNRDQLITHLEDVYVTETNLLIYFVPFCKQYLEERLQNEHIVKQLMEKAGLA